MGRRLTALAATALAVGGLAACGGGDDEGDELREQFPSISQRIVALGRDVGAAIETAASASDEELAGEFGGFARQLGQQRRRLKGLEAPEELADERDKLADAMNDVRASLDGISEAAERSDPEAAREATVELIQRSRQLRDARRTLARELRESE